MEQMQFPKTFEEFIEEYSFADKEEVYTNGSQLMPVHRIQQGVEHYFPSNEWISVKDKRPPNLQAVLTCDRYGNIHIMTDWSETEAPFGITKNSPRYFPPLWWMPLPKSPRR